MNHCFEIRGIDWCY